MLEGASYKIVNSPVNISYLKFIEIDRNSSVPLYLQIANQHIISIQNGRLPPKTKLAGTRALSNALHVHRNTVTAAYRELSELGWVEVAPSSGTMVAEFLPTNKSPENRKSYPAETSFSFPISTLLENPYKHVECDFSFNDGVPDIRLTQVNDLSRLYSANMKRRYNRKKMNYYHQEGSRYFKEQLAGYLRVSRGLNIFPKNLLVTRSTEMSLFIISEIILQKGDFVVVGDLSYFSANMVFQKSNSTLLTVPVDEDGLNIDALEELCKKVKIRMVYVTPHRHYPTTVSLIAQRRILLLELAKRYKFVIVEDDYDYDFHYENQPLLPLASMDTDGSVIYVGNFGKSLAPGFRTGFICAPENLMIEMRKYLGIIDRQGDVLMEQALGEMIEEGLIQRYLTKSSIIYRERRDAMAQILTSELDDFLAFNIPTGGLVFWAVFKKQINLLQLSNGAAEKNLFIPKTLLYQNKNITAMRIGFGHLDLREIRSSISILKNEVAKLSNIN